MKYPVGTKLKCVGCKDCGVIATVDNQAREWDWDTDWQPVAPAVTLDMAPRGFIRYEGSIDGQNWTPVPLDRLLNSGLRYSRVVYGDAAPQAPAPMEAPRFSYDDTTTECPTCRAKPGSPTVCGHCLARRAEHGVGIVAAKSLTPEPWRPSCPDDHWIPDVGEHGERKP